MIRRLLALALAFAAAGCAVPPVPVAPTFPPSAATAAPATAAPSGPPSALTPEQAAWLAGGAPPPATPAGSPATSPAASPTPAPSAADQLPYAEAVARLAVMGEYRDGYDRDLFRHWVDADGDGCDTREEVLMAEAVVAPVRGAGCALSGGSWTSAYDGLVVAGPRALDIDHLVPLAEAWDSGASLWSPARRQGFANDLGFDRALIAVSAASNRSKSDRDPAEWLPPLASARCAYLADWVAVKLRWSLSADAAERLALVSAGSSCAGLTVPLRPAPAT